MRRLQPGRIVQQDDGSLLAPDFGDTYASRAGALAQSRAVFLAGCDLPARLAGRSHTVLETGFGTGLNALALAQMQAELPLDGTPVPGLRTSSGTRVSDASTADACHIHYVGIEAHPLSRDDLALALAPFDELAPWREALLAAWPLPMQGFYRIPLGERFTLTLVFDEVLAALQALECGADSVFLDGFAPDRNPAMWRPEVLAELVAHCRPGARIASWCVAGQVRRALEAAGCQVERKPGFAAKRERLEAVARFERILGWRARPTGSGASLQMAPQSAAKAPPTALPASDGPRGTAGHPEAPPASHSAIPERALIIGAGIAGASAAVALAARGIAVTVIEADAPASGASGNPLGVVRPEPSGIDHPISALTAWSTWWLERWLERQGPGSAAVRYERCGALRLPRDDKHVRRLREHADAAPADWMHWMPADQAMARTGQAVAGDGVWIADGLSVVPGDLVRQMLTVSGATLVKGEVRRVECQPAGGELPAGEAAWRVTLADGSSCTWPLVIVANAFGVSGHLHLPLRHVRGQLSWAEADAARPLDAIVCREGYVTPALDGRHIVGATFQRDDADLAPRDEDDETNRWRLSRLVPGWGDQPLTSARVSVRAATPDRLPLVGALAPGLFASLGHGSRGLTCAPLCGELLASRVCGEPLPLPRDLVRRLDPLRFGELASHPERVKVSDD